MAEKREGASTPSVATDEPSRLTADSASTGELIGRLTQQTSDLVHSELQLAKAEMTAKAKHAGVGAGLFGTAGVVALYGVGALIAAAILALALLLAPWLAALLIGVALLLIAGIIALVGKKQVRQATPAAPEQTIDNVKRDVKAVKEGGSS